MGFFKQTTDLDLGETSIENIFINDFMPMADGTAVKVYLLAYKFSQDYSKKKALTNAGIAKHLNLSLEDVLRSWDFWEEKGIVVKTENDDDYDIEFLSLRQLIAKGLYTNKTKVHEQTKNSINMIEASKSPEIRKMFYNIDHIMRRQLVPNERNIVLEWIYTQNINMDLVERAFKYCVETRGVKHINYIASVVRGWHDKGILTTDQLDEHFEQANSHFTHYKTIYRTLGYSNKMPSAGDKEIMDIWLDDFKLDIDFIIKVLTETSKKTSNINMNYMHKAIETLVTQGVNTIEAFEEHLKNKPKKNVPQKKNMKNQFHNFKQSEKTYSNEELEKKLGIRK